MLYIYHCLKNERHTLNTDIRSDDHQCSKCGHPMGDPKDISPKQLTLEFGPEPNKRPGKAAAMTRPGKAAAIEELKKRNPRELYMHDDTPHQIVDPAPKKKKPRGERIMRRVINDKLYFDEE